MCLKPCFRKQSFVMFLTSLLWSPIGPKASCLHPCSQTYSRSGCCWNGLAQPYIPWSCLTSLVCGALQDKGIMGHIGFLHATMKCGWLLFFIDKHTVWCGQSYKKIFIYACFFVPGFESHHCDLALLWPLLLTWINFNPSMDDALQVKKPHQKCRLFI